ncbi:MAG TPA: winged helix-turn-helix transcriptional regulator [Streptosporangiaceae bacterium]
MTQSRRYDDPCGIARALDVIGDRWALLVVRELIFGPKRFAQLRAGLHPISPNVLSQRLRDLESGGVIRRDELAPPASVPVYELTGRGRALEPVLLALGRWGSQEPITTARELTPDALLVALKTAFDPSAAAAAGDNVTYALEIGGDVIAITVAGSSLGVTRGRAGRPAAGFRGDVATMRAVLFGRETIAHAERAGRLTVTGDRVLAERFTRMFPVRRPQSAQAAATTKTRAHERDGLCHRGRQNGSMGS